MLVLILVHVLLAHANAQCQIDGGTVRCRDFKEFEEGNFKATTVAIISRLRGDVNLLKFQHLERFIVHHSNVKCEEILRNSWTTIQMNGQTCQNKHQSTWTVDTFTASSQNITRTVELVAITFIFYFLDKLRGRRIHDDHPVGQPPRPPTPPPVPQPKQQLRRSTRLRPPNRPTL